MADEINWDLTEARHTPPRENCRHPEWWTSDDAQATEHQVTELVGGFVRALQPEYCIETGSWTGQTTHAIGKALQRNGHGRLDAIELREEHADTARVRCAGLPVTVHLMSSMSFTPPEQIDFAWLDSDPDLRVPEFRLFSTYMHAGTIVGFHDTSPHHAPWAEDIYTLPDTRAIYLPTPRGVTFLEVLR